VLLRALRSFTAAAPEAGDAKAIGEALAALHYVALSNAGNVSRLAAGGGLETVEAAMDAAAGNWVTQVQLTDRCTDPSAGNAVCTHACV
jgi:hypothetical protein